MRRQKGMKIGTETHRQIDRDIQEDKPKVRKEENTKKHDHCSFIHSFVRETDRQKDRQKERNRDREGKRAKDRQTNSYNSSFIKAKNEWDGEEDLHMNLDLWIHEYRI